MEFLHCFLLGVSCKRDYALEGRISVSVLLFRQIYENFLTEAC